MAHLTRKQPAESLLFSIDRDGQVPGSGRSRPGWVRSDAIRRAQGRTQSKQLQAGWAIPLLYNVGQLVSQDESSSDGSGCVLTVPEYNISADRESKWIDRLCQLVRPFPGVDSDRAEIILEPWLHKTASGCVQTDALSV
jgi:hypothetical protein